MILRIASVLGLVLLPSIAQATAPSSSLRPELRPGSTSTVVLQQPELAAVVVSPVAVGTSLLPKKRPRVPKKFLKRISARGSSSTVTTSAGSVCGNNAIKGTYVSAIPGKLRGCGIPKPVKITSVSGVLLRNSPTINCNAAKALNNWVSKSVKPAVGNMGGGVASLRVAAGYSCRTRNNQPGAKISEHGRGNAIDISAINLKNGVSLTVLKGWRDRVQGKVLKRIHKEACGTFGTVLGPNSDRFHQDHFHFDVARHRGGAYCR